MSLKGKKSNTVIAIHKNHRTSYKHYLKHLKRVIFTLCFFSIIAVPVYAYMHNNKIEHDLSVIGNGLPTVVQVHDPGCRLCNRLKSNLNEVKNDFKDSIQFKTANILKQVGRDFAKKHDVPHVTLLFFERKGKHIDTITGVTSSDIIKANLTRLSHRK